MITIGFNKKLINLETFIGELKTTCLERLQQLGYSLLIILLLLGLLIGIGFAGVLIIKLDETAGAAMHIIGGDFQQEIEILDGVCSLLRNLQNYQTKLNYWPDRPKK